MKKKITLLFAGLLPVLMLMAQVPVMVTGDVNIASANVKSMGAVTVASGTNNGKIVNTGTLSIPQGISFVSDANYDGMLHNTGTVNLPSAGNANSVMLKKKGLKPSTWYYISFPFKVNVNDIMAKNPGMTTVRFRYYDSQNRANTDNVAGNWVYVNDAANPVLDAMTGYCFYYNAKDGGGAVITLPEVVFPAAELTNMYNSTKTAALTYKVNQTTDEKTTNGYGWNAMGPAYTANYTYSAAGLGLDEGFVYQLSALTDKYTPLDLEESSVAGTKMVVPPFSLTFIKTSSAAQTAVSFSQSNGGVLYPAEYLRSSNAGDKEIIKLSLSGSRPGIDDDKSTIMFGADYSQSLSPLDGPKMFSSNDDVSECWINYKKAQLFSVKLPFVNSYEIPFGVKIGASGTYTIGLDDLTNTNYSSIVLIDNRLNTKTDLLKGSYSFTNNKEITADRFTISISKVATGMDQIESGNIRAYAQNHQLHVEGLSLNDQVQVFDVTGRVVVNTASKASSMVFNLNGTGVYIVKISGLNNQTLKVLNQ